MKVKELIEKLQSMGELQECEVTFADFEPVRDILSCQIDGQVFVCITDKKNLFSVASQETQDNNVLDIDEMMHEQQERDMEFAEQYAEMMADIY